MYYISKFSMGDMVSCGASLRKLSAEDRSMEEIANSITQYFYDNFRVIKTGETAFALVRFLRLILTANSPRIFRVLPVRYWQRKDIPRPNLSLRILSIIKFSV